MKQRIVLAILGLVLASSCGVPQNSVEPTEADRATESSTAETSVTNQQLPINQRFATLDEYLAYLEETQAPLDRPWYKKIGPDTYELQTGNLRILGAEEPRRVFTREELERKFGFRK